jgi:hypothetical protein
MFLLICWAADLVSVECLSEGDLVFIIKYTVKPIYPISSSDLIIVPSGSIQDHFRMFL